VTEQTLQGDDGWCLELSNSMRCGAVSSDSEGGCAGSCAGTSSAGQNGPSGLIPTVSDASPKTPLRNPLRISADERMNAHSATKLLKNLWMMFEPLALLQYMQEGHLSRNLDLVSTAKRFLEFPIRQYRANLELSTQPDASKWTRAAVKTRLKKQHKLRKAWFGRLLSYEPGILDYFMTAEPDALNRAAKVFDELADHLLLLDIEGHANIFNTTDRRLRGLTYGPLMVDKYRGAMLEWMVLQHTRKPGCTDDARLLAKDLAVMRQLLRRLRPHEQQENAMLEIEQAGKSLAEGGVMPSPAQVT